MLIAYAARGIAAYEVRLALDFLRCVYEFGAARLAFRNQPLPSKPVIPKARGLFPVNRKAFGSLFRVSKAKMICLTIKIHYSILARRQFILP